MNINSKYLKYNIGYKGPRAFVRDLYSKSDREYIRDNLDLCRENLQSFQVNVVSKANSEIIDTFNPLLNFESLDIYVHGSWADDTKTPFSDLDDLIIVDDELFKKEDYKALKKALIKTESTFQKLDPLQHHGHWIISKSSLENYDASFIPLFILENAVRIQGRQKLNYKINIQATKQGLRKNLTITKNNIARYFRRYQDRKLNIYELKSFVGSILLIPPMLFQYQGDQLDKRTAIHHSSSLFGDVALKSIEWASLCRRDWKEITTNKSFKFFAGLTRSIPHPKYARMFASNFSPKVYSHLYDKWLLKPKSIDSFVDEIESYL